MGAGSVKSEGSSRTKFQLSSRNSVGNNYSEKSRNHRGDIFTNKIST